MVPLAFRFDTSLEMVGSLELRISKKGVKPSKNCLP